MRVSFDCAREDLIKAMTPFRDSVVPIQIPARRNAMASSRTELCQSTQSNKKPFTESHTKFVMIHLEHDAAAYRADLPLHRITVGGAVAAVQSHVARHAGMA